METYPMMTIMWTHPVTKYGTLSIAIAIRANSMLPSTEALVELRPTQFRQNPKQISSDITTRISIRKLNWRAVDCLNTCLTPLMNSRVLQNIPKNRQDSENLNVCPYTGNII